MGTIPQFLSPGDAQRQKEADAQMAGAVGGILAYRRQQQQPQLPSMDPAALQPVPSALPTVPGPASMNPMGQAAPMAPQMAQPGAMMPPPAPMGGAPMGAPMGGAPSLPPGLNLPPMPPMGGAPMGGAPAMLAAGGTPSGPFPPEAMQGDPLFANMPQDAAPSDPGSDPAAWGVITADKLVPLMQQFLQQGGGMEMPEGEAMSLKPPPTDFMKWLQGGQSSDPFGQMLIGMYQDDPSPETAAELFAMLQDEARDDPESVPRELIGIPGIRIRADLPSPTEAKESTLSRIAA